MAIVQEGEWKRQSAQAEAISGQAHAKAKPLCRVLIVGVGKIGQSLAKSLASDGRYLVVGFIDDEMSGPLPADNAVNGSLSDGNELKVLGTRSETVRIAQQYKVDEILIAYAPTWQQQLLGDLAIECPKVRLKVVPSPFEALLHTGKVQSYDDVALIKISSGGGRIGERVKRFADIVVALVGLILLAPLMAVIAALIKLVSPGPVLFAQQRVGRYGVPFMVYKFRTMVPNAEAVTGPVLSIGNGDPRLHPIGQGLKNTRVDEIPQLWNVLRGEMSLVGPRPERPCFVEEYDREIPAYSKRHLVRPGITGLAQVCGHYHTDARDKLRFDLVYVSQQSLLLDLSILLRTVSVCLLPGRGVSR